MQNVQELKVWQAGMDLAVVVYQVTKAFPRDEMFGLTSQARRAASAIPANIAEGFGRFSDAEMRRYCQIAYGSLCELETHLRLALRVGLLTTEAFDALHEPINAVRALLLGTLRKLASRP